MTTILKLIAGLILLAALALWAQRQDRADLTMTQILGRPSEPSAV